MPWWIWFGAALLLLLLEVGVSNDFYLMFFSCGALAVGLIGLVGLELPLWVEALLFAVLSIVSLVLFRGRLIDRLRAGPGRPIDSMIGEAARTLTDIKPGEIGQAELRGSVWKARNAGTEPLAAESRCRVEKIEGLTLSIKAE